MKNFAFLMVFMIPFMSSAQTKVVPPPTYLYIISEIIGDLNKDGIPDRVIVSQDTMKETAPYLLQIFFGDKEKGEQYILSSKTIILPQFSEGRDAYMHGNAFENIEIRKGILLINSGVLRGHYTHKFRYQRGNFELVGYTYGNSGGVGVAYYTDFNLSTGVRIEEEVNYKTEKTISYKKTKLLIRPLPKLQEVTPFEGELY